MSCSGLLFGEEVMSRLREHQERKGEAPDLVFLPRRMFDFQGVRTLDEWTVERFQAELNTPVIPAEWTREVLQAVRKAERGTQCFSGLAVGYTALSTRLAKLRCGNCSRNHGTCHGFSFDNLIGPWYNQRV